MITVQDARRLRNRNSGCEFTLGLVEAHIKSSALNGDNGVIITAFVSQKTIDEIQNSGFNVFRDDSNNLIIRW